MWKCAIKYFAGRIGVFSVKLLEQLWKLVEHWTRLPLFSGKTNPQFTCWGTSQDHLQEGAARLLGSAAGVSQQLKLLVWSSQGWVPSTTVLRSGSDLCSLPCTQLLCVSKGLQLFIKKESRSGSWHWKKTPNVWLSIVNEGSMHIFGCVGKEESCGCLQYRCDVWRGS